MAKVMRRRGQNLVREGGRQLLISLSRVLLGGILAIAVHPLLGLVLIPWAVNAASRYARYKKGLAAKKHFWFEPEWLEVLTFLAGLVDDATPLMEAVEKEHDDLFGSMLYLKARLVWAARKAPK